MRDTEEGRRNEVEMDRGGEMRLEEVEDVKLVVEKKEHTCETHTSVCPRRTGSNGITHTSKRRFCFSSKK